MTIINEEKILRSTSNLKNLESEQIKKLILLGFMTLIILKQDGKEEIASNYAKKTLFSSKFSSFKISSTDLYNLIHVSSGKYNKNLRKLLKDKNTDFGVNINKQLIFKFLKKTRKKEHTPLLDRYVLKHLNNVLEIDDSNYHSMQILVRRWEKQTKQRKQLVVTRLLMALRRHGFRYDLRKPLEKYSKEKKLELKTNVKNPEKKSSNWKSTLSGAAVGTGLGAGAFLASRKESVGENASVGASSAGGVATVAQPIGSVIHRSDNYVNNTIIGPDGKPVKNLKKKKKCDNILN